MAEPIREMDESDDDFQTRLKVWQKSRSSSSSSTPVKSEYGGKRWRMAEDWKEPEKGATKKDHYPRNHTGVVGIKVICTTDGNRPKTEKTKASKLNKSARMAGYRASKGKNYMVPNQHAIESLSAMGQAVSKARKEVMTAWNAVNGETPFKSVAKLESAWSTFIDSNAWSLPEGVKYSLGIDDLGMQRRKMKEDEGWNPSGGKTYFLPYYIQGGIMRGGAHPRMYSVNCGGQSGGGVPDELADGRKLISVEAKYAHPMHFPSTRIVKWIRGHWGRTEGAGSFEPVV